MADGNGGDDGADKPVIFISYSHKDEPDHPRDGEVKWRSFVQKFLQPAVKSDVIAVWTDQSIRGGEDLDPEIKKALARCDIFVLLVSPNSMASDYIVDVELAGVRRRQAAGEPVHFYPLVLTPTPREALAQVHDKNLRPRDARPFSGFPLHEREQHMTDAANEIADIAKEIAARKAAAAEKRAAERARQRPATTVPVHTSGLPDTPYVRLVGRDEELKRLDAAWTDPAINVVSLVAEGGAGKSALVNEWLERLRAENYRGAERVLGWSFYSQGSKERATAADASLNWAVKELGIASETTSASAKGEAIAEALAQRRVLLVLDGVEPLQHGPGPQCGHLKDLGLRALLRRFAAVSAGAPHGLIVLTSRLAVADLAGFKASAPVVDVERLSDMAGAALLRDNCVWGTDRELKTASKDFGGHPLALGLLASLLKETQHGDIRRRDHVRGLLDDEDDPRHGHAKRVMESYETEWLAGQPVLLAILRMVGLFDRPASGDCLKAIRKKPPIEGLTEPLVDLNEAEWNRAVSRLRDVRLLSPLDRHAPDALDAHPLVREWFGESLHRANETAWKAAHSRLFDHLRRTTKEGNRPTLEKLGPLYQAIAHGCRAGRHQDALDGVFRNRICRHRSDGDFEYYSSFKLGALGSDLAAITWFFDTPYQTPLSALSDADRSWVLAIAAFRLRAQGRFAEALPALRAVVARYEAQELWRYAAINEGNLSEAELLVHEVGKAITTAARASALADRSSDTFRMMTSRTIQAVALDAAGRRDEAAALFADAERRQQAREPEHPRLYSVQGYRYCDLLLAKGAWAAARGRAAQTIIIARRNNWLLDIALDTLTLGRAHLGPALAAAGGDAVASDVGRDDARTARAFLNEAVDGLRAAGQQEFLPRGLLARAVFRRSVGDWEGAARDLDEVLEIAEPGPMKLHLCDLALERARLAFVRIEAFAPLNGLLESGNPPKPVAPGADEVARLKDEAAEHLKTAEDYITSCGYHRRDEELAELLAVLRGERRFADLPPRV